MVFTLLLYISLAIFIIGSIYKIYGWFSKKIGISVKNITTSERITAALGGILKTIFSIKIFTLIKAFIFDVVIQKRILKEDFLRWLMHTLLYGGFMLLLLLHALDDIITEPLFHGYYSTVNPYFFLRNLFALMVIAGLVIALYRRFILKVPRLKTSGMDSYAIIIVAVIIVSGILLEGIKIASYTEFKIMVEDYAEIDDPDELKAVESYWVENFGVVSPNVKGPFNQDILEQGLEVHEANCAECHSASQWAFGGYATARVISPVALFLDSVNGSTILWYIHILACFFGLAYLPFSKMFHIIATPVSLLANAVMEDGKSSPANILTKQIMELDACTRCGTCSLHCSAVMASESLGNEYILPSEKISFLKAMVAGKELNDGELKAIQEGVYLCTNCNRCTVVCPSGINLKELWFNVREHLLQEGYPEPLVLSQFSFIRGLNRDYNAQSNGYFKPIKDAQLAVAGNFDAIMDKSKPLYLKDREQGERVRLRIKLQSEGNTYSSCFGCQTCTTICPVVGNYDDPEKRLGLLPHQIMFSLGLGLVDMAAGSKMIWDCLTCYQCQEECPQNVKITDILYDLKNFAVRNLEKTSEKTDSVPQVQV